MPNDNLAFDEMLWCICAPVCKKRCNVTFEPMDTFRKLKKKSLIFCIKKIKESLGR